MTFMPEFREARNFPSPADNLPRVGFGEWAGHGFASIAPAAPLAQFLGDVQAGTTAMPLAHMPAAPQRSRDFVGDAHWALYVGNYLEGFHLPFLHAGLNEVVDNCAYRSALFR